MKSVLTLKQGTAWRYVGNGPGRQLLHLVTWVTREEVTTWSEPVKAGTEAVSGYSWHGPVTDFLREFKAVTA